MGADILGRGARSHSGQHQGNRPEIRSQLVRFCDHGCRGLRQSSASGLLRRRSGHLHLARRGRRLRRPVCRSDLLRIPVVVRGGLSQPLQPPRFLPGLGEQPRADRALQVETDKKSQGYGGEAGRHRPQVHDNSCQGRPLHTHQAGYRCRAGPGHDECHPGPAASRYLFHHQSHLGPLSGAQRQRPVLEGEGRLTRRSG